MFERVHGSASDIAGKRISSPLDVIWSAVMMLGHLGRLEAGAEVLEAAFGVLAETPVRTGGLGGTATTAGVARAAPARAGAHRTV